MSAIESQRGVGQCPERPRGLGHVWAGTKAENGGDESNPCRFCRYSGRRFFREATLDRYELHARLLHPSAERVARVREDIARADRERPWQGEGQDRRRVPRSAE
jgi:hypothetical protein